MHFTPAVGIEPAGLRQSATPESQGGGGGGGGGAKAAIFRSCSRGLV